MDNTKKKILIGVGVSVIAVLLLFWITSGTSSKEKSSNTMGSLFSEKQPDKSVSPLPSSSTATTTRPHKTPDQTKEALNELPVTAGIDMHYPELYLSHRWEAIINGGLVNDERLQDTFLYNSIAITELNDPNNSDLEPATFTQLRELAIDVVRAEATGVGTASHPAYFTPDVYIDNCTSFETVAAGAISMPYPNDNSWVMATVYWKAKCTPGGAGTTARTTEAHHTIYLHWTGSKFEAVDPVLIPRIPINYETGA
ncbi:MAG TPA: hypothetical protein PKB15_06550 [Acidimicrobiia bacterium]|nr:hypothetical protein [Acidimicrobiia bacterium]